MSSSSAIEWTSATWNPVAGCSRVSPGCDNCYAMRFAHRFSGPGGRYEGLTRIGKRGVDWSGVVRLVPSQLDLPLRWRKPRRIFVNSMSDLFHPALPYDQIDRVFGVMWACKYLGAKCIPGHDFQVLTKRLDVARDYLAQDRRKDWAHCAAHIGGGIDPDGIHDMVRYHEGPHPRIWIGASVEDRARKSRIDELRQVPAAVRFLSLEPLIEDIGELDLTGISWVIVGGESGPGAREFDLEWARDIVEQCRAAGVACFVKQLGAKPLDGEATDDGVFDECRVPLKLNDRKGGDWSEWPADLRVREFPKGSA